MTAIPLTETIVPITVAANQAAPLNPMIVDAYLAITAVVIANVGQITKIQKTDELSARIPLLIDQSHLLVALREEETGRYILVHKGSNLIIPAVEVVAAMKVRDSLRQRRHNGLKEVLRATTGKVIEPPTVLLTTGARETPDVEVKHQQSARNEVAAPSHAVIRKVMTVLLRVVQGQLKDHRAEVDAVPDKR